MMAVKFKVGFTMSAETLFGIIAKFLPVEDLQVEEVPERLPAPPKVDFSAQLSRPKNRPQKPPRQNSGNPLEGGCNAVILKTLEDGQPHRYRELKQAVIAAGYAGTGIGSKLSRLRDLRAAHQPLPGMWQIGEAPATKKTA